MIIFTESAHKEVLRRIELIKHFQDKYAEMLHLAALNARYAEYIKAYNAYNAINITLIDTVKSFVWGYHAYEAKNEMEWRLELLHRELDALGEQIVLLKNYLKADNEMQSLLASDAINSNKNKTNAKVTLSTVSVSPDNTVYFQRGEMPRIYHSPIGATAGLSAYTHIDSNSNNNNVFINSSNSNNNNSDKEDDDNIHSLKFGK